LAPSTALRQQVVLVLVLLVLVVVVVRGERTRAASETAVLQGRAVAASQTASMPAT
jgi:hypothetical protein